jgi:DNA invertase Pin-like site-specific DNA recombinase
MKIGYARVSTDDQNLALQLDALQAAACGRIFEGAGISGAQQSRPGLDQALAAVQPGDTLTVWRLDRLGRSLPHLVSIVHDLGSKGIGFCSITEAIDTTTAGSRRAPHRLRASPCRDRLRSWRLDGLPAD